MTYSYSSCQSTASCPPRSQPSLQTPSSPWTKTTTLLKLELVLQLSNRQKDLGRRLCLWQDRRRPDVENNILEEFCLMDPSHLPTPRGLQSEQQDQNIDPPHETLTSTSLHMYTHLPVWCPSGKHAALSLSKSLAVNLLDPMGAKRQAHTHMCTHTHTRSLSPCQCAENDMLVWVAVGGKRRPRSQMGTVRWRCFWNSIYSPLLPLCTPLTRNT